MAACLQAIVRQCGATALPPKTGAQSGGCQAGGVSPLTLNPSFVTLSLYSSPGLRGGGCQTGGVTVQHKTPAFNTFITLSEAAPLGSLTQGDNSYKVLRVFNGRFTNVKVKTDVK